MEQQYERYFKSLPCYLSIQSRDFKIIDANKRFTEEFGKWEGRYCYQVYKNRSEKCEACIVDQTFRDGAGHSSEEQVTSCCRESGNNYPEGVARRISQQQGKAS